MEKPSFPVMLSDSFRFSRTRGLLLFGIPIALSLAAEGYFIESEQAITLQALQDLVSRHPYDTAIFLVVSYIFSLIGKSGLICSLDLLTKKDSPKKIFPPLSILLRSLFRGMALDFFIVLFFLVIMCILSLPFLIASDMFETVPDSLITLFIIVIIPILIVAMFVRQFSFFYFLLSPVRLRAAFETSMDLLLRHRRICFMFGILLLIIALLFTFSFNLVMLGIVMLFQKLAPEVPQAALLFIGILALFTWYETFKQTLWFLFFRSLALPKAPETSDAEPVTLETRAELPLPGQNV